MSESVYLLDLRKLGTGVTYLTPAFEKFSSEAACVCLEDQNHKPGVKLTLMGESNDDAIIQWDELSENVPNTWRDEQKGTEYGAYCVALTLMVEVFGLSAFEWSRKRNGFDFWLKDKNGGELFQDAECLEVSGIRNGDLSRVKSRLNEKVARLKKYEKKHKKKYAVSVVVVEFGKPMTLLYYIKK